MTISQELINQLSESEKPQTNPNNRLKYLHIRKDIILQELAKAAVTLDGVTFNGKPFMTSRFQDSNDNKIEIRFDAVSVAYKQNENGDLDYAFVLKSPKDEYVKRIGRNLSDTVLALYMNLPDQQKSYITHYTDHYGYHAFVGTIPVSDILDDVTQVLPPSVTGKIAVSDIRNSVIVGVLKNVVYGFIHYTSNPANIYHVWYPTQKI